MESWRRVWRLAEVYLPTKGLEALLQALREGSQLLLQGATTSPPPLQTTQGWDLQAGDPWVFAFWQAQEGEWTVGEGEENFARLCFAIDQDMGEPAGCRFFLNWWDDTPRDEAFALLAKEVAYNLACRYVREANVQDCPLPLDKTPLYVLADWLCEHEQEEVAGRVRALEK